MNVLLYCGTLLLISLCVSFCKKGNYFMYVNDCPRNKTSWDTAANNSNCSTRSREYYHCLMTPDGRFAEFCTQPRADIKDECPVVTRTADGVYIIDTRRCESKNRSECPSNLISTEEMYKYPVCMKKEGLSTDSDGFDGRETKISTEQYSTLDVKEIYNFFTSQNSSVTQSKTTEIKAVYFVLGFTGGGIFLVGCAVLCVCHKQFKIIRRFDDHFMPLEVNGRGSITDLSGNTNDGAGIYCEIQETSLQQTSTLRQLRNEEEARLNANISPGSLSNGKHKGIPLDSLDNYFTLESNIKCEEAHKASLQQPNTFTKLHEEEDAYISPRSLSGEKDKEPQTECMDHYFTLEKKARFEEENEEEKKADGVFKECFGGTQSYQGPIEKGTDIDSSATSTETSAIQTRVLLESENGSMKRTNSFTCVTSDRDPDSESISN